MKLPRRWKTRSMQCSSAALCVVLLVPLGMRGPAVANFPAQSIPTPAASQGDPATLKVLTLNIAHGRKHGTHQALQRRSLIESNLNDIADLFLHNRPHIVALQEADGPSIWSGGFDHVDYLTRAANFPSSIRGEHVRGMGLSYGTAILSQTGLSEPVSVTFPPSPPTFTKGFVVSAVRWPGRSDFEVDVVSVHLDFLRKAVRQRQVRRLAEVLKDRKRPLVVMGDFNCGWCDREETLRQLAEDLQLQTHTPEDRGCFTFPSTRKRLDWILISPELEFVRCEVLPDRVSDHLGVLAELRIK